MNNEGFSIDDNYIEYLLNQGQSASIEEINKILDKGENFQGLNHLEISKLLSTDDKEAWNRIFSIAGKIKEKIYGDRVVIFAPLYISDYCVNKCEYCGFNCDNKFDRKKLTMEEIRSEVAILEKMGHKRLALEVGEDPINAPIDYVLESIKTIYDMKFDNGEIRRVNVNIAATTVENYKKLKDIEIGTYILFQETYHKATYEKIHISGPKKNYEYHTTAFDRAMKAGIDDVGGGILFGFYDYKYEIIGLMLHNEYLESKYGVGFHTISVPRICKANGVDEKKYGYEIDDDTFKKIVALIRIAVPYTGIILSTRENADMRRDLIHCGVSQVSAGSSPEVMGYTKREHDSSQFSVEDERCARDVIYWLMEEGLIPSFCTACYRKCRTGDRFMELAKSGNIKNVCQPNALLTLKEYCLDYGDQEFVSKAIPLIKNKLNTIENLKVKKFVEDSLIKLEEGQRDLYI